MTDEERTIWQQLVDDSFAARRQLSAFLIDQQESVLIGKKESRRDRIDPDLR